MLQERSVAFIKTSEVQPCDVTWSPLGWNATGATTPEPDWTKEPTYQAGVIFQRVGAPIIIILGLVGNTLSLLVMVQEHNRRISACLYMGALAVLDNGALLTLAFLWTVTEFVAYPWSPAGCRIWVFIVFITTGGSAITISLVTLDRCIAVRFPLRSLVFCTPRRARVTLTMTLVCLGVFYIPLAIMSEAPDGKVCAAFAAGDENSPGLRVASIALSWVNLIVVSILPFILILTMNILIIKAVRERSVFVARFNNMASYSTQVAYGSTLQNVREAVRTQQVSRNRQIRVMLLTVSFAYLIITFPISVRVVVYNFVDYKRSAGAYGVFVLLYNVLNILLYSNNAINFYLYCITGSKFRQDLKNLFVKKKEIYEIRNRSSDDERVVNTISTASTTTDLTLQDMPHLNPDTVTHTSM